MDLIKFSQVVQIVIDNLEGGYYHPLMIKDGRIKDSASLHAGRNQSESGETMYGLDRVNGGNLNTGISGIKFWKLIDDADASHKWKWNYKGGDLAPQLKQLMANIMFPQYDHLCQVFMSQKSQMYVNSDSRLSFHFAYATWNGPGFFKNFAHDINNAVASGIADLDKLVEIAMLGRTGSLVSLIKGSGEKIVGLVKGMAS